MATVFSVLDYCVLIFSLAVSSSIGIFFAWKDRNRQSNAQFFMGSRQLSVFPVCMSLMASFMSAVTILAYPAEVYTRGAAIAVSIMCVIIAVICAAEVMIPVFYRLQLTSVYTYLECRFESRGLRQAVSLSNMVGYLAYFGIQLYAPAIAIEAVTGIPVSTSILTIGIICTFYTTIGGLKAVVWTDVIQMFLILFGLALVFQKASSDVGGFAEVFRRTQEAGRLNWFRMTPNLYMTDSFWNIFIGMGVLWFQTYGVTQMQVQRCCCLPTLQKARLALYINLVGVIITFVLAFGAGLSIYAFYHGCDPLKLGLIKRADQLMPYYVSDQMNIPGIPGLFVATIFAASLSTLSSGFNSISACVWEDFISPFVPNDITTFQTAVITRSIAILIGAISIGFGFMSANVGNIMVVAYGLSAAVMGPQSAVFLCGITMPFVNTTGVSAGFFISVLICLASVIGKLVIPPRLVSLPTVIEFCNNSIDHRAISLVSSNTRIFQSVPILETLNPSGFEYLYHIHSYLMPAVGFIITMVLAVLVSLITGGNNGKQISASLFNEYCFRKFQFRVPETANVLKFFGVDTNNKINRQEFSNNDETIPLNGDSLSTQNAHGNNKT